MLPRRGERIVRRGKAGPLFRTMRLEIHDGRQPEQEAAPGRLPDQHERGLGGSLLDRKMACLAREARRSRPEGRRQRIRGRQGTWEGALGWRTHLCLPSYGEGGAEHRMEVAKSKLFDDD